MDTVSLPMKITTFLFPFILVSFACILEYLHWKIVLIVYISYCIYANYYSKSVFFFNQTKRNQVILSSTKYLKETNFKPYFLLPTHFLQTLFFPFISKVDQKLNYIIEKTNDFGSSISYVTLQSISKDTFSTNNSPFLILLPGITGDESDAYINNMAYEGLKNNYNVIIYNNRLLSDEIVLEKGKRLDLVEEFDSTLSYIEKKFPNRKIYAIGFSYGANKLLNFLGLKNINKEGKNRILAGVSVANLFHMPTCQKYLYNTIYDNLLLFFMQKKLRMNYDRIKIYEKDFNLEIDRALKVSCVREYDELITSRILGFKSADDYYQNISCVPNIPNIQVPTLCINSLDDGITTSKSIPYKDIMQNDNLILLCTDRGGHLVWMDNKYLWKLNQWINQPVIDYLNTIEKLNL